MCDIHAQDFSYDDNWTDFAVFCLAHERRQTGVWENVSLIADFPIWVYKNRLPSIGPIFSIPDNSHRSPSLRTFRILDDLARLQKIWDVVPNALI